MSEFDLAVIGAGAVGASAAYHAAREGKRVVLLEQFGVGHERGSSHGESRIIRHSYTSEAYASLAPAAFQAWRELERESGQRLLTMTGGVDIGARDDPAMAACLDALNAAGIGSVLLEGDQAREAFPQFVLGEADAVLWQSGAGILNAGMCLRTLVAEAAKARATLRERSRVTSVEPGKTVVIAYESDGRRHEVSATAAVLAAGPWAGRFFSALGLNGQLAVTHQQVVYYPVTEPDHWRIGRCPIYIAHGRDGFYGFPECERPGSIKLAVETAIRVDDPDEFSRPVDAQTIERLNEVVATRLRGVMPVASEVVTCRYTETPDRDFIVDRHPEHPHVVVASPCSGHGFKFSIVTGALAADLATMPTPPESLANWRAQFALGKARGTAGELGKEWRD